jgi:hypothetical protein
MQREKGYKAPGSGYGYPHGKHKKELRIKRLREREARSSKCASS